ncbi:MAG TPA: hypothetical protein PLD84_14470, partial [Chitinophagales bacterium]|nr:hypothetical protein [Chitinophagales bacterium]
MKFSEIKYIRPDLELLRQQITILLEAFSNAVTALEQIAIIDKIYRHRAHFETMSNVANIRHTINTSDPFFEGEQDYFDNSYPIYLDLVSEFYKKIIGSTFRNELEEKYGHQ